ATTVIAVVVFYHFYTTSYFFRFSLVPVIENRFTVEGYTLFSFKHLADILNQFVLLLPGIFILLVSIFSGSFRSLLKLREVRYLLVLVLSTLGIVFVFDPRLGMPRDWDLFSFVGVPLSVACYYIILSSRTALRASHKIIIMAITCGLLLLIPRAVAMIIPDVAITHFQQYRTLDSAKNKNAAAFLSEYYIQRGDSTKAKEVEKKWMALFPQQKMLDKAVALTNQGKFREAADILHEAVDIDPLYWNAWVTLGKCHYHLRQFDSALYYLDIALGFNPDAASAFNNKGATYLQTRDFAQAERMFLKSLEIDTAQLEALSGLTSLYRTLRRENEYVHYLLRLTSKEHAPMGFVKELGDYMVSKRRFPQAAQAYRRALTKGLDSTYMIETVKKYPELQQYFR
ncbi:MAG: tetratricopeptide repeat protein, partial [candidate division Zixibacteria bacterium]|nr:tetratricopeptide repeat protein [candidate division Zixibacteria bacterium]